jgi:hypothetical protein
MVATDSMYEMIKRLMLPLAIHSWGGLGSQLFTANLVLKLQLKYPSRRIRVFLHTSGFTRRELEFDFTALDIEVTQVEDFNLNEKAYNPMNSLKITKNSFLSLIKPIASKILLKCNLLNNANNDADFDAIKPWTLAIRGHYTRLSVDAIRARRLYEVVYDKTGFRNKEIDVNVIHCRLGDLLLLGSKMPIDAQRLDDLLERLKINPTKTKLLTDSTFNQFIEYAATTKYLPFTQFANIESLKTIQICVSANEFIGTTAKISLWSAIFRYFLFNQKSYLPKELSWITSSGLRAEWY